MIYTPWSNLKKDGSMVTGQVGFKDQRKVGEQSVFSYLVYSLSNSKVGQAHTCRAAREPDCQPTQQDKGRKVPRSATGAGRQTEGAPTSR